MSVEEGVDHKLSLLQNSVVNIHDKVVMLAAVSVHLFELFWFDFEVFPTPRRIDLNCFYFGLPVFALG